VAEFIQMNLDVIATHSSAAVAAAKHATSTIPIVMLGVASPERQGLVASLARPGGNVTGMSNQHAGEFSGKTLQVLKDALPHISTLAILWNPDNLGSAMSFREGEVPAAQALGLTLLSLDVRGPGDLDRALATVAAERPDALLVHSVAVQFHAGLLDFAAKHRLPTVGTVPLWPRLGGLMSFGPDLADLLGKRLELLKEAAPGVSRVAVLANPAQPGEHRELSETEQAARAVGVALQYHQVRATADFHAASDAIVKDKANALLVFPEGVTLTLRRQMAEFSVKHPPAQRIRMAGVRRGRWPHGLRIEPPRNREAARRVRGQDSEGCEAWLSPYRTAHEGRICGQPQDRQGSRPGRGWCAPSHLSPRRQCTGTWA
jgi:putative tryptophan/tyrosine transport system substrate-binding protein